MGSVFSPMAFKEAFNKEDIGDAEKIINSLRIYGIDIDRVCEQLLLDGVKAFKKSFDALLSSIETCLFFK